ncbi:MAG TPA: hypothetical protein VKU36_00275 [Candidatus Babeliales bacterium]|nr:hypothetical protein [Candidatus Babeliales bacterium]
MKYTIKKSTLSKVALIALATIMGSYALASHHEDKIGGLSSAFTAVESDLSLFVDTANKTSFNTYMINFTTTLQALQRTAESVTRGQDDELSQEIDQLLEYALQQFNILLDVFKRYNGKPDSQAVNFATEIKREFDIEKIFAEMVNKLKNLRSKAQHAGNKQLVKHIEELAGKIQHKKKAWNNKSNLTLVAGLVHRMKCQ